MKKNTLALMALLSCSALTSPVMAQGTAKASNTSKVIYDFSGWNDANILDLFYRVQKEGRKYPTLEEFQSIGIQASDLAFVRSHVRRAKIMDRSDALTPNKNKERELWMNLPIGTAKEKGGYPDSNFSNDVYSIWNYTNVFGAWNHGLFQAPGCVMDAAHKNGTHMYSGIKFFDTTGNPGGVDAGGWTGLILQTDASSPYGYKYVEPILNCLMYFGADGINYNWEASGYSDERVIAFHQALQQEAKKRGYEDFKIGMYTSNSSLQPYNVLGLFGDKDRGGKTCDVMLNYNGGDFTSSRSMGNSVKLAKQKLGTTEGLYTGVWIVTMDRSWSSVKQHPDIGICLWGEHAQSRFFSYNSGADAYDAQANYQRVLERAVSGGNRNPLTRPRVSDSGNNFEFEGQKAPLSTFCGLSEFVAERSGIQGNLPFATTFTLGNGDRYFYKGKTSFGGSWYNMGAQDIVPTYRWLITDAGTMTAASNIEVNYTHKDAYIGGSSIALTGQAKASGTDITLYKTHLKVSGGNPYVKVAVKDLKEGTTPSNLYVILKKSGSAEWIEVPVGDITGKNWQEKQIAVTGLSQDEVIEKIGLRVKGNDDKYSLLVGKLEVNDAVKSLPAAIKDLQVEVKEETKNSMGIKAYWTVDQTATKRADWDLLYNDEANIDHFELLYKVGEKGKVSEIARTTSWADYVGGIRFENAEDVPYIGVRAVSTDLKTYSDVKWVAVTRGDQSQLPEAQEEDTYGVSAMDPGCDGAATAREQRYISVLTTTGATKDLDYKANGPVADGSQYADMRDMVLEVNQGQEVELYFRCNNASDGLKWCFAGGWMDLDGSGNFNHPRPFAPTVLDPNEETDPLGECIFKLGKIRAASEEFQQGGVKCKFTVPKDAHVGKSRLRIVFSDAWFAGQFLPTGLHAKGFTIDFGVNITGTNEQRGAVDTRDQGTAEEPECLDGNATGIEQVKAGSVSTAKVEGNVLSLSNVEKAWIYSVDGKFVKLADNNPTSVSLEGLVPGAYLVKMLNNNVMRSAKFIVK